jgi:hypothetical protein
MIDQEAQEFGKWLAVDDDGTAHVFRKKPTEKIRGKWITTNFESGVQRACVSAGTVPNFEGKLLKRKKRDGEFSWTIQ